MMIEDVIQRLRAFMIAMGWSKTEFATKAGLSINALRGIERDDWSPTAETIRRLEAIIPEDFDHTNDEAAA